jgi:hypothetical protein
MSRSQTRKIRRDTKSGKWVSVRETKRRPNATAREYIPLPGHVAEHGAKDDAAKAGEAAKYRDSNSGRFVPVRDRHPSKASADRIQHTSKKASESLKRLAKR